MNVTDTIISTCTELYKDLAAVPIPINARIITNCKDSFCILTSWSSEDFVLSEKKHFTQSFTLEKDTLKVISSGILCEAGYVLLHTFSKSGAKQVIFKETKHKKFFLEVWNGLKREITFDYSDRKEHGKVYTSGVFKNFELSPDEKFLLYTAEEKPQKSESYFTNRITNGNENEDVIKGEEFSYRDNFGECYPGVHHPVLCMMEISTGIVTVLETVDINSSVSVGEARWGAEAKSVAFVGFNDEPYKLGVWACRNRRSSLYLINKERNIVERLTDDDNICVRSPRFSPDFRSLVYLENTAGGPHFKAAKLKKLDLKTKQCTTVIDVVNVTLENGFPGLYLDVLPSRCWSEDGTRLYFSSFWRSSLALLSVKVDNGQVQKVNLGDDFGSVEVLDVFEDVLIAKVSSLSAEPCLVIGSIDNEDGSVARWTYLDSSTPVRYLDINWEVVKISPDFVNHDYPNTDYEIIVVQPAEHEKGRPLIIMPHGGPHACYTAGFFRKVIGFVKLGFLTCLVNYRGSVGFGENNLNSLPGNVGTQDVADVQQAAVYMKNNYDVGDVFVFGGSHGGFLTAHVTAKHPDFYKAAVLLNPGINMISKIYVGDIPDWNWVESGIGEFNFGAIVKSDQLGPLWDMSPIKYAENVKTPSLLLLAKNDRRVPLSQGLSYYHILKARNIPVKICQYEDNHSLRKTAHDGDVFLQTVLWFKKYSSAM